MQNSTEAEKFWHPKNWFLFRRNIYSAKCVNFFYVWRLEMYKSGSDNLVPPRASPQKMAVEKNNSFRRDFRQLRHLIANVS